MSAVESAEIQNNSENHTAVSGNSSVFATLGIEPKALGYQFLNVAVVMVIVWFLILKPLVKKLDERKRKIDESLDRAKEIEGKMLLADTMYREKIVAANAAADDILADAHTEAKKMGEMMKDDTKKEILGLVTNARAHIQKEKEQALSELQEHTATLAISIAEKILEEKIDAKKDHKIIADTLSRLAKT